MSNRDEIVQLINQRQERSFFDVKRQWHTNKAEMLHDILCLSNAKHDGQRYLVFGVDDSFGLTGLQDGDRQSSANIFDWFNKLRDHFSEHKTPSINIETFNVEEHAIDVIRVANDARKPFYLERKYRDLGSCVWPYRIYTRIGDTNTPIDRGASAHDIRSMYAEQLGLFPEPLDRLKALLSDGRRWRTWDDTVYHHPAAPQYTYETGESAIGYEAHGLEWARGEVGYHLPSGNYTNWVIFRYHSTVIHQLRYVGFDGGKKHIVAPDYIPYKKGRLYYYEKDTIDHLFHLTVSHETGYDQSLSLNKNGSGECFGIPVLTADEVAAFEQKHSLNDRPETDEDKQNELFYEAMNAIRNL